MDVFIDIGENFSVPWFVCNGYSRFTLLRKDGKWLIEKVEIDNNVLFRMLNKKEFRTVSNEELHRNIDEEYKESSNSKENSRTSAIRRNTIFMKLFINVRTLSLSFRVYLDN